MCVQLLRLRPRSILFERDGHVFPSVERDSFTSGELIDGHQEEEKRCKEVC